MRGGITSVIKHTHVSNTRAYQFAKNSKGKVQLRMFLKVPPLHYILITADWVDFKRKKKKVFSYATCVKNIVLNALCFISFLNHILFQFNYLNYFNEEKHWNMPKITNLKNNSNKSQRNIYHIYFLKSANLGKRKTIIQGQKQRIKQRICTRTHNIPSPLTFLPLIFLWQWRPWLK